MQFARVLKVRQNFPNRAIQDIPGEVARQMAASGLASRLAPGGKVAIGVGSRGISNIAVIVRAVVDYWKSQGADPFIFPAMGSHGAATAEGQAHVLANFGVDEAGMGCPIRSQLAVVRTGRTPDGLDTWMDKLAYESDGVFLVGRVKWHTDFTGDLESGLFKMTAIGLGKFAGAQYYHIHAYKIGFPALILSVGRHALQTGKILGGLAILEDERHTTAKLEAVPADKMEEREKELLKLVKTWMPRIPVKAADILIVNELGKDISGAGMDTKVINRLIDHPRNPWPDLPRFERILVRGISDGSYGSAMGIGMADMVTDRLVESIEWEPTLVNALTSTVLGTAKVPIHYPSDRECLQKLVPTVGKFDSESVTLGWIRNTLQLDRVVLSENLLPEIEKNPSLEVAGGPQELAFGSDGNLLETLDEDW